MQRPIARGFDTSCAQSYLGCMLVRMRGSSESLECKNSYDIYLANHVLFSSLCIFRLFLHFCFLFCSPIPSFVGCANLDWVHRSEFKSSHQRWSKGTLSSKIFGRRRLWLSDRSNRKPFQSSTPITTERIAQPSCTGDYQMGSGLAQPCS